MRILFVHNYYQQRGGEDAVFEAEVELLRENGYAVETVEFTNEGFDGSFIGNLLGAVQSLYNSQSARRVEQAIDTFRPDVVHIHNLFYTASPSVIRAAKRKGIPVVMTLHNYRLVCNSGMLSREAEIPCERCLKKTVPLAGIQHACFRNSRIQSTQLTAITSLHKLSGIWKSVDKFIVLTEFAREKILESSLNLHSDQVVVKPNFTPEFGYTDSAQRGDSFLYLGRLHYEKGIQSFIKAAYLHQLPVEIIGDGPFRPLVEKAVSELPHVKYWGSLPREKAIARMKHAKAIVVPSICYEGLPTAIIEAFATGTPVICSDQRNLNTIVSHQRTGLLFKTGDEVSLATQMRSLTDKQCGRFVVEGYKLFQERYVKEVVFNTIIETYRKLI